MRKGLTHHGHTGFDDLGILEEISQHDGEAYQERS